VEKWGTGLSCSPSQNTVLSKQPCFQCVMLDGDQLYRRSNSSYMLHFLTMPPTFCNITLSLTFNRQFVTMLCLMYGRQVNQVEKATRFQSWSMFKETVRTNNDVEGWHTRLNTKSLHGNLDMYQLAPLLHAEAMHTYILYRLWSLISISTVLARPK